jgi:site-specific DNA recombinase
MKNIRYIPIKTIEYRKRRVAAYYRISTSGPVQMGSLEIQIEAYTHMFESCPEWIFVGSILDFQNAESECVRI